MKAFFLTAGLATRFRPQSEILPKPLMPFWGLPLFTFSYEFFKQHGFDTAIFNLHHLSDKMKHGALKYAKDSNLIFSYEENLLGSGGALIKAQEHLDDHFFLANGDEVFLPKDYDLSACVERHHKENRLASLFYCNHAGAGKDFGAIWLDGDGYVKDIGKNKVSLTPKHYVGLAILSPEVLHGHEVKELNILYDMLYPHLNSKRVVAEFIDMQWFEMGNVQNYLAAHKETATTWLELNKNKLFLQLWTKYMSEAKVDTINGLCVYYDNLPKYKGFAFLEKNIRCDYIHDAVVLNHVASAEKSLII